MSEIISNNDGTATPSSVGGGAASMVIALASLTTKYLQTSSTSYKSLAQFIYAGSNNIGAITNFNVNAWGSSNGSFCVRFYDITNANVIAEIVDITSQDEFNIRSMGTIANLPTTPAVIEVQGQRATGGGGSRLRISSVELQYA